MVLKVDSVELAFGNRKILQDVYLSCRQGEIVGLLGRNGCGKSSLLKIIFGVLSCNYKHVSINDNYIVKGYYNNRIAYLPQHNYLPGEIKIKDLAPVLVDPLFWAEFSDHSIYKTTSNSTPSELSGGQLRQLETLMIIYSRADFILLDEPFTHITPVMVDEFKHIIKRCAAKKGIIVTDHQYYNILDISDRIILIKDGCTKHITDNQELVTYGYLSRY
ncbi:ATP-binding cassette domain-containing protein [Mucilaginibacter litoreus]|uniref:ATP-binding cassette domain-containing protein n=1 Tax=Mucilaginibacter litoreus TaxID=1048221 RepID=A0ABW3AT98_9SPHI